MSWASNSHWATLEVCSGDVHLYDSAYTSAVDHTLKIIAQLLHSKESCIQVQVMNTAKQKGSTDCGLYAIATLTCLALNVDPTSVVFDQEQLRTHLIRCLEKEEISEFPVIKRRRPASRVTKIEICLVYCYCRLPDNEEKMVLCEKCEEWFHLDCIDTPDLPSCDSSWYCATCKPVSECNN